MCLPTYPSKLRGSYVVVRAPLHAAASFDDEVVLEQACHGRIARLEHFVLGNLRRQKSFGAKPGGGKGTEGHEHREVPDRK